MSEHHGFEPPAAEAVTVTGEPHDDAIDPVPADEDLMPDVAADSDGIESDIDDSDGIDSDAEASEDEGADGEVLVLDTWQIQLPATGDAAVDAALAQLTEVEGLAPAAHPEVYEAVHTGLQEALADLDRT